MILIKFDSLGFKEIAAFKSLSTPSEYKTSKMFPTSFSQKAFELPDPQESDELHDVFYPHTKTPSSPETEKRHGGNGLMNKLFRKQSSASRESKYAEMEIMEEETDAGFVSGVQDGFQERLRSNELEGLINPCPFIRPLEHKLQPRDESTQLPNRVSTSTSILSDRNVSAITIARKRGETNRLLTGNISDDDLLAIVKDNDALPNTEADKADPANAIMTFSSLQIDSAALRLTTNIGEVREWERYLECYSKGQFNLNNPPPPPQMGTELEYLPAVYPYDEVKRISLCTQYEILWPQWASGKAGALVRAAMKTFGTRFASLSWFDEKSEIFKAENGFNQSRVDRAVSIAAHALYSPNVLVVLDTMKDWRFERNPLVVGMPRLRFYASAPLLSSDGQVMGVFSIFGREPRASFTPQQCHELASYSSKAMQDLNLQADWLSNEEMRSTPLLERDSIINGTYHRQSIQSPFPDSDKGDIDTEFYPSALRYHKSTSATKVDSRLFIDNQSHDVFSTGDDYTPPSSGEDEGISVFESPKGFGKNPKQLSVCSSQTHAPFFHDMLTPDTRGFRKSSPRPFSSSDITSLNPPHPPNTPVLLGSENRKQPDYDMSIDEFMALSDRDCLEEPEDKELASDISFVGPSHKNRTIKDNAGSSPLIDLTSPMAQSRLSLRRRQLQHTSPVNYLQRQALGAPSLRLKRLSTNSTILSLQTQVGNNNLAEAAFTCALTAQSLSFDLLYAVEVKPTKPFSTDKELLKPGGMQMKILCAYGMKKPVDLTPRLHLTAIRCRGWESWESPTDSEEEFASGCLIPMHTEGGPIKFRSSGILGAAYRSHAQAARMGKPTREDMEKLVEAMDSLKAILMKPDARKTPTRANTGPPTPNNYPVNEASKLQARKYSHDAGAIRGRVFRG